MKQILTNHFTENLPGDPNLENSRRQVLEAVYSWVQPQKTAQAKMIHVSEEMATELGFSKAATTEKAFLEALSGNALFKGSKPYAMCYGGHQFGHWAGQLGDGRAINLGELSHQNKTWTLQLKGAGPTPYSRTADGLAVLRSSIREYLCSEAMHHLGVPTTRALSIALTGDQVLRDVMYDGHHAYEKGAIVCRVAPSFLRFGNFEILAARGNHNTLKTLVDYTITTHFSSLGSPQKETYISLFKEVSERTLATIIHWQRVGFVHGVLNTDNMSILGLTIDYGPYGWLEGFDLGWTPNTTDHQHKRYRYGNQPHIGLWNLYQLANALYPLVEESEPFEEILEAYKTAYEEQSLQMMQSKLGLSNLEEESEGHDEALIAQLTELLSAHETDMTIFFRNLSNFHSNTPSMGIDLVRKAAYHPEKLTPTLLERWSLWFSKYTNRLEKELFTFEERRQQMNTVNPKYVLRNYMAQLAIDAADKGDYTVVNELYTLLKNPYDEQPAYEQWFAKRPEWARHKIGCSMLSCSS